MRNNVTTPQNKERKFRPVRLVIACLMIALLLITTSVGLSYARYKGSVPSDSKVSFVGNEFIHAHNVVMEFIKEDDSTVLNYKDEIIVTVPKGLSAASNSIAYALIIKSYQPASYDISTGTYGASAKLQLIGVANSGGRLVLNTICDSNNKIDLKVKADRAKDGTVSGKIDGADRDDVERIVDNSVDPVNIFADFTSVSGLGTKDTASSVSINFERKSWADSANTEWYDPEKSEFTIGNAADLAGLAKLVNEEGIDFDGVTITLNKDISLYGAGGKGDMREWTPIGTEENPFKGNFDGNGNTITGLNLSGAIEAENVGLFGVVEGDTDSVIKDLALDETAVYAQPDKNTGTVVGKATGYTVSNVEIFGLDVSGDADDDGYVGSIAGEADDAFTYRSCAITFTGTSDEPDYVGNRHSSVEPDPTEEATEAPTEAPTQKPTRSYELPAY